MSLVGSQVFANAATSCWLAADNAQAGDLTVNGTFTTEGPVNLNLGDGDYVVSMNNAAGTVQYAQLFAGSLNSGRLYVNAGGDIYFGRPGSGNGANTTLTLSAGGANTDVLAVGGTVSTRALASSTCSGTATIPVGAAFVVVNCPVVQAGSKIILSKKGIAQSPAAAGPGQNNLSYEPAATIPNTSFKVWVVDILGVTIPVGVTDVLFDWLVIN